MNWEHQNSLARKIILENLLYFKIFMNCDNFPCLNYYPKRC